MSTTTTPSTTAPNPTAPIDATASPGSRALSVRRGFVVAAPVLAGLCVVVAALSDPAGGISGTEMNRIYTENPGPLQLKSLGYHWAYAFWIGTALLVAPYVRGRGSWLANVAALLGFAGMTTLPGLLAVDWYDSAVGQLYGPAAIERVHDHMDATMWGLAAFMPPGFIGLLLALPLAAAALWRAGRVRWWAPAAVVAGTITFAVSEATWWGAVATALFLGVFAVALRDATRPDRTTGRA